MLFVVILPFSSRRETPPLSPKSCAWHTRNQIVVYVCARPNGTIAQLVEQRIENPCVPGSNPGGTTLKRLLKRSLFLWTFDHGLSISLSTQLA